MSDSLTTPEYQRYARHLSLPEVGEAGQVKLKSASVVCIGAGGLGSVVLMYLAAAGVGRVRIIDFDTVDVSNLQRQVLYGTRDIGKSKAQRARARLHELNPHVEIDVVDEALTIDNALEVLAGFDVIVDGTDNFRTRYLANDAAVILGIPYVYGSIFRFEGQASVFNYRGGPNYRDLYPKPPAPGSVPSCAQGGVLGVLPGMIACIQATETLKILLDLGHTLSGRLLTFDAKRMHFSEWKLSKDPSAPPITKLVDETDLCGGLVRRPILGATELKEMFEREEPFFLLDVREAHEAHICQLPRCDARLTLFELKEHGIAASVNELIVVYCRSGARSVPAAEHLREQGYERVVELDGGILQWIAQVDGTLAAY